MLKLACHQCKPLFRQFPVGDVDQKPGNLRPPFEAEGVLCAIEQSFFYAARRDDGQIRLDLRSVLSGCRCSFLPGSELAFRITPPYDFQRGPFFLQSGQFAGSVKRPEFLKRRLCIRTQAEQQVELRRVCYGARLQIDLPHRHFSRLDGEPQTGFALHQGMGRSHLLGDVFERSRVGNDLLRALAAG